MQWQDRIGRRIKFRDLHIALAVAQSGSMLKAAEALAISQPVVSKVITDLEQALGVRLFDRSRKGVVPPDLVRQLSYDRADAVRKSIIDKYKFDPNKFKVLGNGWDNPVAGMTDPSNPEHNKKNRRVEVKVFPLEKE